MRSFPTVLALLPCSLLAQAVITPLAPMPDLGTMVIDRDFANVPTSDVVQFELRSRGAGVYRVAATVRLQGRSDSKLVAGLIDLAAQPAVWTPTDDFELIDSVSASVDEYAATLSSDETVVVFDHALGRTWPSVPQTQFCFVCRRTNPAVPFQPVDVRAVQLPFGFGFKDPHIGQELPNGNVLLFWSDAQGEVSRGELDPAIGVVTNVQRAATHSQPIGFGFTGSNYVLRDSLGNARALLFGEYWQHPTTNVVYGDMYLAAGVVDDGAPRNLTNAGQSPTYRWYANGSALGGSVAFALSTSAGVYTTPQIIETTCVANTDLTSGSGRIAGFAPIRPRGNGLFVSLVALGVAAAPYSVPPVLGDIGLVPTIGLSGAVVHDLYDGLAEWVFTNVPPLGLPPAVVQMVTLDAATMTLHASNVATLALP
jgi:hypothetical protein